MKLLIQNIIKETNDALSISFKNGNLFNKLNYKPGQFLTLHIPIGNVIHKRAYSFSSSPYTDKDLKITIKRVKEGLVSNYIHDFLKVGDKLKVDKPTGSFVISPKKETKKQYVLFAGGSGITPIFSILKSILVKEPDSKILLVYANKDIESIIFNDELNTLKKEYPNKLSVEHVLYKNNNSEYHSGLITEDLLTTIFSANNLSYELHSYMICGPTGYMEAVKSILESKGIDSKHIKIEMFKPKSLEVSKNLVSDVTIKVSGEAHQIKVKGNSSILQQATSSNIKLPYSCRSGMCSSCKAKCVEGEVKMTEGHFLSESDVEKGHILTCISYPVTKNVTIEL